MLKGHAVIGKESRHSYRGGAKNTKPACGFFSHKLAQPKIYARGDPNGKGGADKLPGRQAEEDSLLMASYFFWNFDFDTKCLLET